MRLRKIDNLKAYWAWMIICTVWGTTYLAIRIGVADLPPMLFAGSRWIIAGSLLFVYLLLRGGKLPNRADFIRLALIGVVMLGVANGLVVFAEQWVPSGLTSLLVSTVPFFFVGIESLVPQGPKLNIQIVIGLVLGLFGVLLIFGGELDSLFNPDYFWGIVSLFFAVAAWAVGSVYSKYKKIIVTPLMGATIQMLVAGLIQLVLGLAIGELNDFVFTQNSFWAFTYLVVFGSLISYPAYVYALKHLPVSFVGTYAYINPVIALFLGWLVLNERLDMMMIASAVVILIAVAVVTKGSKKAKILMEEKIQMNKS